MAALAWGHSGDQYDETCSPNGQQEAGMIPNQWYIVMDSSQIKDKAVGVIRMGEKLVFWRDATGKAVCLRDKCVHRGVQLSKGKIIGDRLQCPFHGLEYDASGRVIKIPANGRNTPVPERFRPPGLSHL